MAKIDMMTGNDRMKSRISEEKCTVKVLTMGTMITKLSRYGTSPIIIVDKTIRTPGSCHDTSRYNPKSNGDSGYYNPKPHDTSRYNPKSNGDSGYYNPKPHGASRYNPNTYREWSWGIQI